MQKDSIVLTLMIKIGNRGLKGYFALSITILLSIFLSTRTFLGDYVKIDWSEGKELELSTTKVTLRIEFCTPSIIRFRTILGDHFKSDKPWMVNRYDWPAVPYQTEENEEELFLKTKELQVQIQKPPFSIIILYH